VFVKVYRYHIRTDKTEEFLDIQERVGKIYKKHVAYRAVYLQSQDDPGLWLEIQWCGDEDTYLEAMNAINAEPGIKELWQDFQTLLDPEKPDVEEECFNQIRSEGDLSLK